MGEFLSAVIGRQGELLKSALKAAKSWDDTEQIAKIEGLQKARTEILTAKEGEQWVINKAIHYNEWAKLSRHDFKPVVTAFKQLLRQFRCEKLKCDSWLSITLETIRLSCGAPAEPFTSTLRKSEIGHPPVATQLLNLHPSVFEGCATLQSFFADLPAPHR